MPLGGMDPYLALALVEGGAEHLDSYLLDPGIDPAALLAQPPSPPEVSQRLAAALRDPTLPARTAAVQDRATALGLQLLTPIHPQWPPRLRQVPLRPLVLFARGDLDALQRSPALAVVGSRTPTPYGQQAVGDFATALVRAGVVLWSGLARGIDGAAHRVAVDAGSPTVAVLAGGLDAIYPPEHDALATAIAASGGCLVSELPPGRRARRGHFPRRNRILALGTAGVLVVEASLTSGALQTARHAAEHGGDVFAVPGPYRSERSQGCHRLIGEGGRIAEDPTCLLRDLGITSTTTAQAALSLQLSAEASLVLRCLDAGPRPSDLVQRETGLDRSTFLRVLATLERNGALLRLPGDLLAGKGTRRE